MPFDLDTPKTFFEKGVNAVDWVVEEIIRQKNWRSLLVLIDVILFLAFNPFQWPFPNLLALYQQLEKFSWYAPVFWSLIVVIFVLAVIVAARARRNPAARPELKLGAIKGLLPFGYEDAEVFSHLQRDQNLKECLQAIGDGQWRLGVLSGESGTGKTSFLQAGLWPEFEKRKFRCVYVKFSDIDPFESVKRACLKRLSFADGATETADFPGLLRTAAEQDHTPIALLFDQFEQFFVHRKRKKDRESFVQALTQWFVEMQSLPIKILICIRGDFLDRLNELQKAMRYSLGPTQSFRLERFEPDQATEVFCFLAEKDGLEYDRKFISEMTRQELADTEDGLISPVDIQVLARMIERQTIRDGRAFNRTTFQKLGGVEGLLERYLTIALEPLGTQPRRQSAIKVLLAMTDLERNARAGALTFEDLRQKLGGDITDSELKEAVAYLLLSDVRLISPSSENEEEKFELAHERLIPALRRLAGKQLSDADRASQLFDRRTNEWLGAGRASRYLFSWSELRLINKNMRFLTWGKQRQAKEELLAASRRRFRLRYAAVGLLIPFALCGWIGWKSNAWQTYLIKRELRAYGARLIERAPLTEIAKAFAYTGDSQLALQVADRISDDGSKAGALKEVAESFAKLGDKEKASALLSDAIKTLERPGDNPLKDTTLLSIAESYAKLGEATMDRALLSDALKTVERIGNDISKEIALRGIAPSMARLGEATKDRELVAEAVKILEPISNGYHKVSTLRLIVLSYARLGEKEKASALLSDVLKIAEGISHDGDKYDALRMIAEVYARFGDRMKDGSLLLDARNLAERIGNNYSKATALRAIAESYSRLGEKEKAIALLSEATETTERSVSDLSLRELVEAYARIGERMKDKALPSDAIKIAERINDDYHKAAALSVVAGSYAGLGDKEKAGALLSEATKVAERINGEFSKGVVLSAVIKFYAKLAESSNDPALYDGTFRLVESFRDDQHRNLVFDAILSSKFAIADVGRLRSLTSHYSSEAGTVSALAHILMARSHPELIGK